MDREKVTWNGGSVAYFEVLSCPETIVKRKLRRPRKKQKTNNWGDFGVFYNKLPT